MDMRISSLNSQALSGIGPSVLKKPGAAGGVESGFAANFKDALKEVSAAQENASKLQTQVLLGNTSVSLEETMVATQKASVGFQAVMGVRNRMVEKYNEIMNMSV